MHRFVEHTAELQLELDAPTAAGVFAEAFAALRELLGADGAPGGGEPVDVRVEVAAGDAPALLADWLGELVFVAERDALVLGELRDLDVDLSALRAAGTVRGRRGAPPPLVKAVTYHELRLERAGGRWHGRVVLDV